MAFSLPGNGRGASKHNYTPIRPGCPNDSEFVEISSSCVTSAQIAALTTWFGCSNLMASVAAEDAALGRSILEQIADAAVSPSI